MTWFGKPPWGWDETWPEYKKRVANMHKPPERDTRQRDENVKPTGPAHKTAAGIATNYVRDEDISPRERLRQLGQHVPVCRCGSSPCVCGMPGEYMPDHVKRPDESDAEAMARFKLDQLFGDSPAPTFADRAQELHGLGTDDHPPFRYRSAGFAYNETHLRKARQRGIALGIVVGSLLTAVAAIVLAGIA